MLKNHQCGREHNPVFRESTGFGKVLRRNLMSTEGIALV
jgi:hypothetical protein